MKIIISVFSLFLATTAFAAKYENIPTRKISDVEIRKLAGFAKNKVVTDGQYGNCGTLGSVSITERADGEPRENTIKQVLWGRYTNSISVTRSNKRGNFIEKAVEVLGGERQDEDDEKAHNALKRLLENALENENHLLYTGGIDGHFSTTLGFIAIWDQANDEIVWFGNGYCE